MEENEIYAIKTLRIYPKQMAGLRADKEMKRENADLLKSKNVTCCSEYDNKPVPMQAANIEGMNQASNFIAEWRVLRMKHKCHVQTFQRMDGVD